MKRIFFYIILVFAALHVHALSNNFSLLKAVIDVSPYYNSPYKDTPGAREARRNVSREINNLSYKIPRYNHGLAHATRQAYLVERIVLELRDSKSVTKNTLTTWLQRKSEGEVKLFIDQIQLLALYYRVGRENELSPSSGTDEEKARFDENMRDGAELFKNSAKNYHMFKDETKLQEFVEALFHYEYDRKNKKFQGDTVFIDQIVYAAHLLDLRRVLAPWNMPPKGPKEMLPFIMGALGYSDDPNEPTDPVVQRLNDYSAELLKATGDRDAWEFRKNLRNDFFYQAYAPELMIIMLNKVKDASPL